MTNVPTEPKHEKEKEASTLTTKEEALNYCAESRGIRNDALIELLEHALETVKKSKGVWFYVSIEIKERGTDQ